MELKLLFKIVPQLSKILKKSACYTITIECLKLVPPYLMKVAVDMLVQTQTSLLHVFAVIGGVLAVSLVNTAVEGRYFVFTAANIFDLETSTLKRAQQKLLELDLSYHENHPSGDIVHLVNKGTSRLADLAWFIQDQFMGAFFQIILTTFLLVYVHPACGSVFFIFMPLVLWQVHVTSIKVQPYRQRYHRKFREGAWKLNQSILNIRTVKDYVQEKREQGEYGSLLDEYKSLAETRMTIENDDTKIRDLLLGMARFAVLFYAVYLVYIGQMTTGTLVLFATLSEKAIASIFRLGRLYNHLGDSMESIRQFAKLFDENSNITDAPNAITCPKLNGRISFNNVTFAYRDNTPVLHDITLTIPERTVTAIVGRSGSGKSTLVKLLSRHYDVSNGSLAVDSIDVRTIKLEEYRRRVAVVSQDIEIFDQSIASNISYGVNATQEEIEQAARAAHAHNFITALPQGYETVVGEKGVRLSGGQRQRVGIARALLMKPTLLVFDEATSSLDTESERLIQSALTEIAHQQTMIVIAHRLSTIKSADMIVVLDEGRIVETGSHDELMAHKGLFARMENLQHLGELRE